MRRHVLWRLIWIQTGCKGPQNSVPALKELKNNLTTNDCNEDTACHITTPFHSLHKEMVENTACHITTPFHSLHKEMVEDTACHITTPFHSLHKEMVEN
ncbi:hypothetical protein DPMN_149099 [Dreissena polymorpha]|uniref:Uncharacterized protein n=1 Tax=Dreissena polymorpha TaxID=45954 RepID=A0A9D4J255_DREPO|nr:hypothetical protein DPMN_149099 [Dreissena polymorpha]